MALPAEDSREEDRLALMIPWRVSFPGVDRTWEGGVRNIVSSTVPNLSSLSSSSISGDCAQSLTAGVGVETGVKSCVSASPRLSFRVTWCLSVGGQSSSVGVVGGGGVDSPSSCLSLAASTSG